MTSYRNYESFADTMRQAPLDDTPRLIFADACDDEPDRAGGGTSSPFGTSMRGALIRTQIELARQPHNADLQAQRDQLLEDPALQQLLRDEIRAVEGWQQHIVPGHHDVEARLAALSGRQLAAIFDRGMVGGAVFSRYPEPAEPTSDSPVRQMAQRMPLTKITLQNGNGQEVGWVTAAHVRNLPAHLTALNVEYGALQNLEAQEALFRHPLMASVGELRLGAPDSAARHHVGMDPGLGSPPWYNDNPAFQAATEVVDRAFVQRLTGGALGQRNLKKLTIDQSQVNNEGIRAMLESPKLRGTVINFTGTNYAGSSPDNGQRFTDHVSPRLWKDLVVHNMAAAKMQGGSYEMPKFLAETLHANRGLISRAMGYKVEKPEDVAWASDRRKIDQRVEEEGRTGR